MISTGELKPWRLPLGEMRPGIFNLLEGNSVGEMFTILAPLGIGFFRVFGLYRGSRSLILMGVLKINSAGEIYSIFKLVEDPNDVPQGISSGMAWIFLPTPSTYQ